MTERRNDDFSEAVRARLQDLNRTQTWLGEQLGVTRQSVSEWMTQPPGRKRVEQIEDALGLDGQLCAILGYMREGNELRPRETFAETVEHDPLLTNKGRRMLLEIYHSLTGLEDDSDGSLDPK